MMLDARGLDSGDICGRLRDIFSADRCADVFIEVLLSSPGDANRVRAFASMSGCLASLEKNEDCFVIRITGSPCGCG